MSGSIRPLPAPKEEDGTVVVHKEPRAEVTRIGQWTYEIRIYENISVWYHGRVMGRERARRKAERLLYEHMHPQEPDVFIVDAAQAKAAGGGA